MAERKVRGTYSINCLVSLLGGDVMYIPKRPSEPDCTLADTSKISQVLGWWPKVHFEEEVSIMLKHTDRWRDAPVWDEMSIAEATRDWFSYFGAAPIR